MGIAQNIFDSNRHFRPAPVDEKQRPRPPRRTRVSPSSHSCHRRAPPLNNDVRSDRSRRPRPVAENTGARRGRWRASPTPGIPRAMKTGPTAIPAGTSRHAESYCGRKCPSDAAAARTFETSVGINGHSPSVSPTPKTLSMSCLRVSALFCVHAPLGLFTTERKEGKKKKTNMSVTRAG